MEAGEFGVERRGCFVDRRFFEGGIALLSLVIVGLVVAALFGGWRRTDRALYADPLGCKTRLCARMTTSKAERRTIRAAITLIRATDWAETPRGRAVVAAVTALDASHSINVWSLRPLQHSRYDHHLGIMINRLYDVLDRELVAVMIVHEATHQVLGDSTYDHELIAYENMLDLYSELEQTTGWRHRELDYLAEVQQSNGIAATLPCEAIFRGDCSRSRVR
jgi:hypothetical protein